MSTICPSLTYSTSAEYTAYMKLLEPFATRVHVDVSDGILAPVRSVSLPQVWWPDSVTVDIHVMYQRPLEHTEQLVSMKPDLVIVHPEADGDLVSFGKHLQSFGIKFGVTLMPDVALSTISPLLTMADHVLIFSGKLGFYGGHADSTRFADITQLKRSFPKLEIGWDGGANKSNVLSIAEAGVGVINVGSGLSKTDDPARAYATLVTELKG